MIYLIGTGSHKEARALATNGNVGLMLTPASGLRAYLVAEYPVWAADSGLYNAKASFDLGQYLDWLASMSLKNRCLFATAPDIMGDAAATWAISAPVLPQIRALGYKAALVGQDGLEDTEIDWDAFDCLFLGGTTAWKLSLEAAKLAQEGKRRGLWVHMGRVNSGYRYDTARIIGCDSVDGTCVAFAPDANAKRILRWTESARRQAVLPLEFAKGC